MKLNLYSRLSGLALGMLLLGATAMAQTTDIPVTITNNGTGINAGSGIVNFGANASATNGVDDGNGGTTDLGELEQPPAPPSNVFDVRFINHGGSTLGQGSRKDYRPLSPSTQAYKVKIQAGDGGYPVTVTWSSSLVSSSYSGGVTITDAFGGLAGVNANMKTASSVTVTNSAVTELIITADGPQTPPSGLSLSGCPLAFGVVGFPTPGTATRTFQIANTGGSSLLVNSITSSDANFVITSPTFPQTIAVGGAPVTVTVTYTATALGADASNIVITYNGTSTTNCNATATASSGEGLYFADTEVDNFDNTTGLVSTIGLKYSAGTPVQGLQFKVTAPYPYLRINSVSLGASLPGSASDWSFDYETENAVSGSEVQIILYGKDTTVNLPVGEYADLFRVTYEVRDIDLCNAGAACDSVQGFLELSDVESVVATYLAQSAGVDVDPNRDLSQINVYSSSVRGDVNCDDEVNILDILEVIDHIQGRKTLATWQLNRADLAPWAGAHTTSGIFCDGTNSGDGTLNIQDVVLISNAILNNGWPNGDQLSGTLSGDNNGGSLGINEKDGASILSEIYDVKFLVDVARTGLNVNMHNRVGVKGIQMFLKAGGAGEELAVNLAEALEGFTVNHRVVGDTLRLLIYSMSGNIIEPMNSKVMDIPFTVVDPASVMVVEPIIAGGANNEGLKVEHEVRLQSSAVAGEEAAHAFRLETLPNPFSGSTSISYVLATSADVSIAITDAKGSEVARLASDVHQAAGSHSVKFDAKGLPAGTYFCVLTANGVSTSQRIVLNR